MKPKPSLLQISRVFLRVGTLGFGGPFASIRMMEEELSRKRRWLTEERMNRWTATCKLLPGPIATQVAIGAGQDLRGRIGGFVAGLSLILPSAFLLGLISWAYFGNQPWTPRLREEIRALWVLPIVTWAILPATAWQLFKSAGWKRPIVVFAFALGAIGTAWQPRLEPLWLIGAGLLAVVIERNPAGGARAREAGSALLASLFGVHFLAGAVTFGSGFAMIPLLKSQVVDAHRWVTTSQFLDGVLFGQITPGPISTTATFIGWSAAGLAGGIVATLGIFAPAFINMLTWVPAVQARLERSRGARGFLDGLLPAVAGSLLGLSWHLREILLQRGPWVGGLVAAILVLAFVLTKCSALGVGLTAVAALKLWAACQHLFT